MKNKRWRRVLGIAILLTILAMILGYNSYIKMHTFTLSSDEKIKSEQIQPLSGRVKVSGNMDTDVVFTDIESGKTYVIGYVTSGVEETINLERGKWYKVEGTGELTMRPVNVRIE